MTKKKKKKKRKKKERKEKKKKIEVEIPKIVGRESKEENGKGHYQKTVLLLNKALEQRSEEQPWIAVLSNLTFLLLTGLGSNLLRFLIFFILLRLSVSFF